jgi:hypothetical protein
MVLIQPKAEEAREGMGIIGDGPVELGHHEVDQALPEPGGGIDPYLRVCILALDTRGTAGSVDAEGRYTQGHARTRIGQGLPEFLDEAVCNLSAILPHGFFVTRIEPSGRVGQGGDIRVLFFVRIEVVVNDDAVYVIGSSDPRYDTYHVSPCLGNPGIQPEIPRRAQVEDPFGMGLGRG